LGAAAIACALGAWPAPASAADESGIALADGPGQDRVRAACSVCHSLDYIVMNSPFLDAAAWGKTVNKMIQVYGAPLSADDAAAIVAYLDRHYGK
jgi:hypothetical protein